MPRLSALPSLTTMTGTVVVPVDDSGVTKKITGAALKAYTTPNTSLVVNGVTISLGGSGTITAAAGTLTGTTLNTTTGYNIIGERLL